MNTHDPILSDALHLQAGHMATILAKAEDARDLEAVKATLGLLAPVWNATKFGHAVAHVRRSIQERAAVLLANDREYLAKLRKNDRTRASTEGNIRRLEALVPPG